MIDNVEKYGPNGDAVAALIERANKLTRDEISQLATAYDRSAYFTAEGPIWDAGWMSCSWLRRCLEEVRHAVKYVRGRKYPARSAVRNAVMAVALKEFLPIELFDVLSAPWRSVIFDTEDLFVTKH